MLKTLGVNCIYETQPEDDIICAFAPKESLLADIDSKSHPQLSHHWPKISNSSIMAMIFPYSSGEDEEA